jgi:DNA polymerase-3 subunit alpha
MAEASEKSLANFVHLRVHSAYSLAEGAMHVKDIVKRCKAQNMPAVAVTDTDNMFGSLEFSMAATDYGIQPLLGVVLRFQREGDENGKRHASAHATDELLLLAATEQGYYNLIRLASYAYLKADPTEAPLLTLSQLEGHTQGVIALSGGVKGAIGRLLLSGQKEAAHQFAARMEALFPGAFYLELMRHGLPEQKELEPRLLALAVERNLPIVATNDVYFASEEDYLAQDALLCIADGRYISEDDRRRLTREHRFKSAEEMAALFADLPEAIENTRYIAQRCTATSPIRKPILPSYTGKSGEEALEAEAEAMREQARQGLQERLENHVFTAEMDEAQREEIAKPYWERLEFELNVIIRMQFPGYFLIVSDFIKWSKQHDIPVGPGRGSGAGSLVAWALFITDLDPIRYGLLFERFLNPERVSMPDFDVDFCQDHRDKVISYVQQRYGRDRVAQIITFGKLQARAVIRDVGRVLQMPYGQVDRISKLVPANPANPVTLSQAIEMEPLLKAAIREDETVARLVEIALKLEGLYRHASTHAAGVVIADRPLEELVPVYADPRSDMPVVQYSMKYAELAGLVKFDFLGLKTLTVLKTAVDFVKRRNIHLDLLKLPEGDKPSYALLGRGETVGVFQLESAGMRDTLRKLRPDTLEDIIALVSLYRPGPMDNIPTYIARKHGHEVPEYPHPSLKQVLAETFGVFIYQEQVMQCAQIMAGYSLGEADLLRRAMGKKIKEEMEKQRAIFVTKSVERGVDEKQAESVFDLMEKFASYGFNKSHAAAYALIAYQTAYLKANFPVEFLAASMTYDLTNTDKLSIFRQEAQRYGIPLLPPDINASGVYFEVEELPEKDDKGEPKRAIRYALAALKGVGEQAMEAVVQERQKNGRFKNLFDFAARFDSRVMNRRQLESLARAGAFDTLEPNRRKVFEGIDALLGHASNLQREREANQVSLFGGAGEANVPLPPLPKVEDWPQSERLQEEYAAVGFYLSAHPLSAFAANLKQLRVISSSRFTEHLGSAGYSAIKVAGIVTGKKIKASSKGRFAFIQLSDADGVYEVSLFDEEVLNASRNLLENGTMLLVQAEGKMEESGPRLIVKSLSTLDDIHLSAPMERLTLHLSDPAGLDSLKTLLGSVHHKGTEIMVVAEIGHGRLAHVRLPGRYSVPPQHLYRMEQLPGVIEVIGGG